MNRVFISFYLLPFGKNINRLHINNVPTRKLIDKGAKKYQKSLSINAFSSYKIQQFTNINNRTIQKFLKKLTKEEQQKTSGVVGRGGGGGKNKQHLEMNEFYLLMRKATQDKHLKIEQVDSTT